MDWPTLLFAARWITIVLVYVVLLLLLVGVYREAARRVGQGPAEAAITYGRLRVIHPGGDPRLAVGTMLNLKTVTHLGAEQDNDIVLGDPFVSGRHLRLRWDGALWWLEDLHSKNGTLVNRQPWAPGRPQPLPPAAVITLGDMIMELTE